MDGFQKINLLWKKQLPKHLRKSVEYSLRTTWTAFITLAISSYCWKWADSSIYLSGTIALLSSTYYFGLWQMNFFHITYAAIIGAGFGLVISLFRYESNVLLVFFFFVLLLVLNSVPDWDRLTYVFTNISFVLGGLSSLDSEERGFDLVRYRDILAVLIIPYIITGFALLICPFPGLAVNDAKLHAIALCKKLDMMTEAVINSFISDCEMDLYLAQFDEWFADSKVHLTKLKELKSYVGNEKMIFPSIKDLPAALSALIEISEIVILDLIGLQDMVRGIVHNRTKEKFAEELCSILLDMVSIMKANWKIVIEYLDGFEASILYHFNVLKGSPRSNSGKALTVDDDADGKEFKILNLDHHKADASASAKRSFYPYESIKRNQDVEAASAESTKEDNRRSESHRNRCTRNFSDYAEVQSKKRSQLSSRLLECSEQLRESRAALLEKYNDVRRTFTFPSSSSEPASQKSAFFDGTSIRSTRATEQSLQTLEESIESKLMKAFREIERGNADFNHSSVGDDLLDSSQFSDRKSAADQFYINEFKEENIRLGLRNFTPRVAFIHRLTMLIESINHLKRVVDCEGSLYSFSDLFKRVVNAIASYINIWITTTIAVSSFVVTSFRGEVPLRQIFLQVFKELWRFFLKNPQPFKISAAVTFSACLTIYNMLPWLYSKGNWSTVVVALIRQNNTSSSFFTAYQRLEGTVIGSVFAFLVFESLNCSSSQPCQEYEFIPILLVWIAFCYLFREGPQHGYSAYAAALTPIVLLLGTSVSISSVWSRVAETLIGVVIYLTFDNLILPKRTYPSIQLSVVKCIDYARRVFAESIDGIEKIEKMACEGQLAQKYSQNDGDGGHEKIAAAALAVSIEEVAAGLQSNVDSIDDLEDPVSEPPSHHISTSPSPSPSPSPSALFEYHRLHLKQAEVLLKQMKTELDSQDTLLQMVVYEPQLLWYRPFPRSQYERLLSSFNKVYLSAVAVNAGSRSFNVVLEHMVLLNENISEHLDHFRFMSKHLFLICNKSEIALKTTYSAFKRFYKHSEQSIDLSSLLSLRRISDKLLHAVDDYFRRVYMNKPRDVLLKLNPYFLIAWQNLFESVSKLIRDLSELGMSLLIIRDTERRET